MAPTNAYRFACCEALAPDGKIVQIPEGSFLVAESDLISIAIRGRILEITRESFQRLELDQKIQPLNR